MPKPLTSKTQSANHKIALFLLGAGATGKTTTRKLLTNRPIITTVCNRKGDYVRKRNPGKGSVVVEDYQIVRYFLRDDNHVGLVGNRASGTDSIVAPELIMQAFYSVLEETQIVIVDGVMSSPRWVDMVNIAHEKYKKQGIQVIPLLVHFDFTLDQVLERLKARRAKKGKVEDRLPDKTIVNADQFIKKTLRAINHFKRDCMPKIEWLIIKHGLTPGQVATQIANRLTSLTNTPYPLPEKDW